VQTALGQATGSERPGAPLPAVDDVRDRTGEERLMSDPIEYPLVYTVTQTAQLLGISRTHAYELVARGDLAHVRLGRRIVVPRQALERLLDVVAQRPTAS
jgi:excisionase family DNA binding protein